MNTRTQRKSDSALRDARQRAGLSQFQLGARAGVHPATISQAERGTRISAETAEKLAHALGVPVEALQ